MSYKGFTSVELRKPKRSLFDMSHERRLTTRMGKLTPIFCEETMPNDTWRMSTEIQLTLAPMLAPIKHAVNLYLHAFFVANRLLWQDWELFITNGRLGTETPPVPPWMLITDVLGLGFFRFDERSLADHLGLGAIPDAAVGYTTEQIAAMPFVAYHRIFWEYYRDRNYIADDVDFQDDGVPSGQMTVASGRVSKLTVIKYRCWTPDYFTSALPWTQRGADVLLPIVNEIDYLDTSLLKRTDGAGMTANRVIGTDSVSGAQADLQVGKVDGPGAGVDGRIENLEGIESEITVNDFRMAIRLQEWLERNAIAGSRYNESIMAHFARKTSDGRLQRPEYLGGMKLRCQIGEVFTTAYSTDGAEAIVPPGNMAGYGGAQGGKNLFTYNCEEHGFIMVLLSIMPTPAYIQGTRRMFFARRSFLDYPWPTFAHLGEQEVYYLEFDTTSTTWPAPSVDPIAIADAFGYQSRYADWKYIPSTTHGLFKSSMDYWHLARKFAATPVIGNSFVTFEDELQDRIFAVDDDDTCWIYLYNKVTAIRSLPYFGTPMT